ncbi:MAG: FxsA family protein [Nitrospinae bacterium]|nr:FxsA family protein [Nitrospinota bacterium]
MIFKLFLLFTLIPIIELMILIDLGTSIGLAPTLGVVILTGALGAWAARTQGFYVVSRIQAEMAAGRLPGAEMVEGAMVLVGGVLLLTPGLLTDAAGFALMAPAVRAVVRGWLMKKFEKMIEEGKVHVYRG